MNIVWLPCWEFPIALRVVLSFLDRKSQVLGVERVNKAWKRRCDAVGGCQVANFRVLTPGSVAKAVQHHLGVHDLSMFADDTGLAAIAGLFQLRQLDLSHSLQLTGIVLQAHLGSLPKLEVLNLGHCPDLVECCLENFDSLRGLDLSRCSNLVQCHLSSMATLQHLSFRTCRKLVSIIQPTMLPMLISLDLGACVALTCVELHCFEHLDRLQTLHLDGCHWVDDDAMRHCGTLLELRLLDISRTATTDAGLRHLHNLQQLEELVILDSISHVEVDNPLPEYQDHSNLQHLRLQCRSVLTSRWNDPCFHSSIQQACQESGYVEHSQYCGCAGNWDPEFEHIVPIVNAFIGTAGH
jgi:hypothetical protein